MQFWRPLTLTERIGFLDPKDKDYWHKISFILRQFSFYTDEPWEGYYTEDQLSSVRKRFAEVFKEKLSSFGVTCWKTEEESQMQKSLLQIIDDLNQGKVVNRDQFDEIEFVLRPGMFPERSNALD